MKFDLGGGATCDLQRLIDTRMLVQCNSGGGKSWTIRRILEQTHGAVQHLVIDPEGEFSSLREKFDYVVAAKNGGDTAADVRSARLLAERLLELRVSAILDIYELKAHERIAFVRQFLEALVDAPKKLWHPALVVVDEAHVFCPQHGEAESAGAVIDLATRGRKRGFCAVLATQRLSKLHKDSAAELNNKLVGRTGLDVDLKRACDELGFGKERWIELRNLRAGAFYAFGPAISREVISVQVGNVATTHPKAGARLAFTAPPPTARVRALLPKLADLPAESEQRKRTEEEMRREISILRRELAAKPKPVEPKVKRVEVSLLDKKDVARLEASIGGIEKFMRAMHGEIAALMKTADKLYISLSKYHAPVVVPTVSKPFIPSKSVIPEPRPPKGNGAGAPLKGRPIEILRSAVRFEQMGITLIENKRLAMSIGLAMSGTFNNYLSKLSTDGYIVRADGAVRLTTSGREAAGEVEALHSHDDVMALWRPKLNERLRQILDVVVEAHPHAVGNEEIARRLGLAMSGTFNNYLSKLSTLGLIERRKGEAAASGALFP